MFAKYIVPFYVHTPFLQKYENLKQHNCFQHW